MRKNTSIFTAGCFKRDWQFVLHERVQGLVEFALAVSKVLFLIFVSYMNLLRTFPKNLLKLWGHRDSRGRGAGQRDAGQDERLAAAGRLRQFLGQAVLCYCGAAEELAGLVNHLPHPTPAPPLCHSCSGTEVPYNTCVLYNARR